jgi:adenylate kinase
MGPPGAGKGTVADRVSDKLGCLHLSTGALLREAIAQGTELGLEAGARMSKGELVPDGLIVALVEDQFDRHGEKDFLLDGFPRTAVQARLLDEGLAERRARVDAVVELEAPERVVLQRLSGRRVCGSCGTGFHMDFIPPKTEGVCDRCGGVLVQRPDDRDEAIVRRLVVYESQMAELRAYYRYRGVLFPVDASGTPEQTEINVLTALGRG